MKNAEKYADDLREREAAWIERQEKELARIRRRHQRRARARELWGRATQLRRELESEMKTAQIRH